jgi:hypothetical protein
LPRIALPERRSRKLTAIESSARCRGRKRATQRAAASEGHQCTRPRFGRTACSASHPGSAARLG